MKNWKYIDSVKKAFVVIPKEPLSNGSEMNGLYFFSASRSSLRGRRSF